jgi:hypothetical protein
MAGKLKVPFFEPYFRKLEIAAFRREAEECGRLARQMLEDVAHEQQPRLQLVRERGPWDHEREAAQLQQTKCAYQVLLRLKRYRGMMQRIAEMERELPSTAGLLGRLRYANPYVVTWVMAGLAVVINVVRWLQ